MRVCAMAMVVALVVLAAAAAAGGSLSEQHEARMAAMEGRSVRIASTQRRAAMGEFRGVLEERVVELGRYGSGEGMPVLPVFPTARMGATAEVAADTADAAARAALAGIAGADVAVESIACREHIYEFSASEYFVGFKTDETGRHVESIFVPAAREYRTPLCNLATATHDIEVRIVDGGSFEVRRMSVREAPAVNIRSIVVQNLFNYNNDWPSRSNRFALIWTTMPSPPDVLSLQEVRYHRNGNNVSMVHELAQMMPGYSYSYFPLMPFSDSDQVEGIAMMVRGALPEVSLHHLSSAAPYDQNLRGIMALTAPLDGGKPVTVFNTHWTYSKLMQTKQAEDTLAFMNTFSGTKAVMGDLNIYSDYTAPTDYLVETGHLWDVFEGLHPGEGGLTFSMLDYPNKTASRPDRLLMTATDPSWSAAEISRMGVGAVPPLSDHAGLLAVLRSNAVGTTSTSTTGGMVPVPSNGTTPAETVHVFGLELEGATLSAVLLGNVVVLGVSFIMFVGSLLVCFAGASLAGYAFFVWSRRPSAPRMGILDAELDIVMDGI